MEHALQSIERRAPVCGISSVAVPFVGAGVGYVWLHTSPGGEAGWSSALVLHFESETGRFHAMTDKQAVIDALGRLPENASLDEITEELRIMAAIRRGRADVAAGRTKTQQETEELVESWASAWTSK